MKNVILKKNDGVVSIMEASPELIKKIKNKDKDNQNNIHMCWENCTNAYCDKCEKIADIQKKEINEYDFISDGIQIINKSGEIDTFLVNKCQNYEKSKPKKLTMEKIKRLQKIKDGLRIAYFDALTLEEAYITQSDLAERKKIKNIMGSRPNPEQIRKMKLRKRK